MIKTLLGFDFGLRHIGVAVGQCMTGSANPVGSLRANDGEPNWAEVDALIREWGPSAVVVGLPWHADGSPSEITRGAQAFSKTLQERSGLPVYHVDERLTSHEAEALLQQRPTKRRKGTAQENVHSLAAKLIVETWMREQAMKGADNDT